MFRSIIFLSLLLYLFQSCSPADKSPTDYVDPFIGTGGHGHTFPGATAPFGMVQLSPDTRLTGWDGCSGYHYSDSLVYGFSHTHLSGTGVSDYGDILFMPLTGENNFNNGADGNPGYRSAFDKHNEFALPGYYTVILNDYNIGVELTATERAGFHRYTFPGTDDRKVIVDLEHRDEVLSSAIEQIDDFTINGHRHSKAWAENQFVFFHALFDQPIKSIDFNKDSSGQKAILNFGKGEELLIKVALSAVDEKGAEKNLKAEIPDWDFNAIKQATAAKWTDQLGKIQVSGGSERQKRIFYTALYHTMIAPNLFHDVDGRFRGTDLKIHLDTSFVNHTVFSLWDTYRSTHPLYTIIERDRTNDFIKTFLHQYQSGGRLPMWELAGNYTGCMIGYHAVPVIADAYVKGIDDYDTSLALESMLHSSNQDRLGIDAYRAYGYIPAKLEAESVSKTLEYAYDDWTIAAMADKLGKSDIAEQYLLRSKQYMNLLDPETKFMRARNNNRWFYPFEPSEVNFNYTEANAWQYSYYVPHDLNSWIDLVGGPAAAEKHLDDLFTADSKTTGRDQADITGLIGQYAHGNEPSHHIPYLYNFVGRPDKTQKIVRQIMDELYSDKPDGLSGNEDCGQMSAWLIMSAMGFYPVTPGSDQYIIGSPWFEKTTINLENGHQFIIHARDYNTENKYVDGIQLNGNNISRTYITHDEIMTGGNLDFQMTNKPTEFGKNTEDRPTSLVKASFAPIPALTSGDHAFFDSTLISLNVADPDAKVYYSFASKDTQGLEYSSAFYVYKTTELYVWSLKNGIRSKTSHSHFSKIPKKRNITLKSQYANHYTAGGNHALVDFVRGEADFRTGTWQGYEGVDLEAIVDLGAKTDINSISIGFLQDENAWIFMPTEVNFYSSEDNKNFKLLFSDKNDIQYTEKGTIIKDFKSSVNAKAKYIKIIAKNRGVCPSDHKGAGGKSWIFADEIVIE